MPLPGQPFIQESLIQLLDKTFRILPQRVPDIEKLRSTKIISHRGIATPGTAENTRPAFQNALNAGVYGIEFDIRFTKDDVPIINHDLDLKRCFGSPMQIANESFASLKQQAKNLMRLEEFLEEFGDQTHLMLEIKNNKDELSPKRAKTIKSALQSYVPVEDFHVMSFEPEILQALSFIPSECFISIARWNINSMSNITKDHSWAGLTGHYFLLSQRLIDSHHELGQRLGSGQINSINLMYREIHRGIDWIFTDCADLLINHIRSVQDQSPLS